MTNKKKILIRILSLTMAVCMAAGLFFRQKPTTAKAGVSTDSLINKIDADIYNDISGLLDDSVVSRLPETVKDDQDISVIVAMSTKNVVDAYAETNKEKTVSEYIGQGEASRYISASERERTSLLRMLNASGIKYVLGEKYDNVLSGFEITIKAKDFYKTERLLNDRNATAIVGEVYMPMETEVVYNYPEIDESTGIFENTIKEIVKKDGTKVKADGSGVVVAVLDTGLDYTHTAFDEERFMSDKLVLTENAITGKLGNLESAKTTKNLKAADVYMSKKVPYAYDYADKDTDVLPINSEHGTHVAGIIAGNDEIITGVAPNAQLAIMKVFSDETDGAKTSWLIAALEDCVTLGVDVINMSLGSGCGFTRQEDKKNVEEIYDKVYEAGISLIASAANSYNSTMGSKKNGNNPLTVNPDSGTVGLPSTYKAALSIASVDGVKTSYIKFNNEIIYFTEASTSDAEKKKDFISDILKTVGSPESYDFEYVYVPGVGKAEEYQEDVTGKIVLVERGDITFEQKVQVALKKKNAAGIIIFNNVSGNISMSVGDDIGAVCSLSRDEGRMLAKQKRGIITISQSNKAGPFMSDFSSWGPTSDLKIKPEITAHGGEIKSAIPGGGYEKLSGTSMAAPNQAGATALVRQYVKYSGNFGDYEKGELNDKEVTAIVNRLMMSTADILLNKNGLVYAIRKQGAGLTSLSKSVNTSSYILTYESEVLNKGLSGKNEAELKALAMDKSKLELGDDKERTGVYKMTFGINNFKGNSLTYDIGSIAITEGVNKEYTSHGDATVTMNGYALTGRVTVNSVTGGTQNGNKVTVAGNSVALVTVTLQLSDEDIAYLEQTYKENEKVFKYGMYVEGFITLSAESKSEVSLNVPFLTYYGDWTEAPIFDEEFYDTNKDELNLGLNDEDKLMPDAYATRVTGGLYSDIATMGTYYFKQSGSATKIAANKEHIALSNQIAKDSTSNWSISSIRSISAGLLRNAKRVKITATEAVTGRVIYQSEIVNQIKSFSNGGNIFGSSIDIEFENEKGEKVAFNAVDFNLKNNTKYLFRLEAFIDFGEDEAQNNARNVFEFPVYVDFEAPVVSNVSFRSEYNKEKKKNRLYADLSIYDNHYSMGVQIGEIVDAKPESGYSFAMQSFGNYVTPIYSSFNATSTVSVELTDYIDEIKKAKGFMLPNGEVGTVKQNTNSFVATCYDYAMNSATYEIRIPDEVLAVYYNEEETTDDVLYLSPNETKSIADLVKVYPYTAWGEVLDYNIEYCEYIPGEEGEAGSWKKTKDNSYVRIANGKVVALNSTGSAEDEEHRSYVLITPGGVTGVSAIFPSLKVYVRSEGEKGFKRITPNPVAKFGIEGYKTVYAHYTLDSEDRDIGFTNNVSELEKDRYGNQKEIKMYPYEKIQLDVTAEMYFTDLFRVNYKSSRPNYAKVDSNGLITALQKGKSTISAIIEKRSSVDSNDWKAVPGIMSTVEIEVKDPNKIQAIYLMSYKGAGGVVDSEFTGVVEIPGNKGITTIYDYAFSGYRYVDKDLDNGDVITEEDPYYIKQQQIGNNFIKKIILPKGVTTINKYAFAYLTALEEIVLPSTLTKIGVGAFMGCNNLKKITFSGENNLQFINKDAFKMAEANTKYYFDDDKEDETQAVMLSASALTSFDFGKKMVAIGNYAFENTSLNAVKLPESCQSIGIGSFRNCKQLKMVEFLSEEMKIGKEAFKNCTSLDSLTINAKVVSASVCEGMSKLENLTLGKDVKVINEKAFAGCKNLKTITVDGENKIYGVDNNNLLYIESNGGRELIFVAPGANFDKNKLVLGEAYKSIARGALSAVDGAGKIVEVEANGVTEIDDYAFAGSSVKKLTTAALTKIGEHAFDGSKIESVCDLAENAVIGAYAFNKTQIKNIDLSDVNGLQIGEYAFANCKLETVKLGDNTVIGDYAFASELFPAYENYMHGTQNDLYKGYLFPYCYAKYDESEDSYYYDYTKTSTSVLTEVTLGKQTTVGNNAFAGNVKMTTVTLGENTVLGDRSFYNNPELKTINLEMATSIGEYAFSGDRLYSYRYIYYNAKLNLIEQIVESAVIAGEERIIGYKYVSLASAIESVELNASTIGSGAFKDCASLTSVTVPEEMTVVNNYTFENTKISAFDLSKIESVGKNAFRNTLLSEADLQSARTIGEYAFENTPVTTVEFFAGESNEKGEVIKRATVYEGAFMYCTALNQANIEALGEIGARAFMNTALTAIDLTNTESLGDFAFGESKVTKVTFGDKLKAIGDNPFYGCKIASFGKLETNKFGIEVLNENCNFGENIFVENGVIYEDVGGGQYQLISYPELASASEYTVKEGTIRIAAKAFYNSAIRRANLSFEIKSIGDKAFFNCNGLTTVVFTSLNAPALEEEYDEFYYAEGENTPFKTKTGGLGIIKYYMWNASSRLNNLYYGANFVNYVGKVDSNLTMVCPINGKNYDEFIYGQYFNTIVKGGYAATPQTVAVIAMIDALPSSVTLDDEEAVTKARQAYNNLSLTSQQHLVSNYEKLTNAESLITYYKIQNGSSTADDSSVTGQKTVPVAVWVVIPCVCVLGAVAVLYFTVIRKKFSSSVQPEEELDEESDDENNN